MRYAFFKNGEQIGEPSNMTQSEAIQYRKENKNNMKIFKWKLLQIVEDNLKTSLNFGKRKRHVISDSIKRMIENETGTIRQIAKKYGISSSYVGKIRREGF
jgi:hypothetical protein